MVLSQLKTLISQGEVKEVIEILLDFVDKHYARFTPEVFLISSRFNQVEKEKRTGTIPRADLNIEMSSITRGLLEIIDSMEGLSESNYKKKESKEQVLVQIKDLQIRFDQCRKKAHAIQNNSTRLREKNEISRKMGDVFIDFPDLIQSFYGTQEEGIITGIANRYKKVPELSGIDFFESVPKNELGNFTKCCIVNALAEIIYSGQMRIGDEKRVEKILVDLFPNSYQTVKLSITRVSAELDYFLGNM